MAGLLYCAPALALLGQICVAPPPNMFALRPGDGNANDFVVVNEGTLIGGFVAGEVARPALLI
jgi:hypothetical protein